VTRWPGAAAICRSRSTTRVDRALETRLFGALDSPVAFGAAATRCKRVLAQDWVRLLLLMVHRQLEVPGQPVAAFPGRGPVWWKALLQGFAVDDEHPYSPRIGCAQLPAAPRSTGRHTRRMDLIRFRPAPAAHHPSNAARQCPVTCVRCRLEFRRTWACPDCLSACGRELITRPPGSALGRCRPTAPSQASRTAGVSPPRRFGRRHKQMFAKLAAPKPCALQA